VVSSVWATAWVCSLVLLPLLAVIMMLSAIKVGKLSTLTGSGGRLLRRRLCLCPRRHALHLLATGFRSSERHAGRFWLRWVTKHRFVPLGHGTLVRRDDEEDCWTGCGEPTPASM
jgi:hypothetical protein